MRTLFANLTRFSVADAFILAAAAAAIGFPAWAHAQQSNRCANPTPPPGAQSLGYVHLVFCVTPTTADIDASGNGASAKLYTGSWYDKVSRPLSSFSMSGQTLVIANGGSVSTQTHHSLQGALPLLLAGAGFYVEFATRLSDNDPDHFPAVWLMPQEHNGKHSDHMPGDPAGYERWMELDVDEGGYNAGHLGTMINWWGNAPPYEHKNYSNGPPSMFGMDRTQEHVFGLSYDPAGKKITWWVDGVDAGGVSTEPVPSIVNNYHYYLIMGAQHHKLDLPYKMYLPYFSAWSSGVPPKPPSGVKATQ
jgi:hypothetical protein